MKNLLRILSRFTRSRSQHPIHSKAFGGAATDRRAINISGAVEDRCPFRIRPIVRAALEGVKDARIPTPAFLWRQLENVAISQVVGAVEAAGAVYTQPGIATPIVDNLLTPAVTAVRGQLVNRSRSAASAISRAIEVTVRVPCEPGEREGTVGG